MTLLRAEAELSNPRPLIFRLDDIGVSSVAQEKCVRSMCERGFRISLGVVPSWLDSRTQELIHQCAISFPGAVEVHLHGYRHSNYAGSRATPYEFGPARDLDAQLHDIVRGRGTLSRCFPDIFVHAFSPPYGEFDSTTVAALKQAGFSLLSGLTVNHSVEMPQASTVLDLFSWNPRREKSVTQMQADWTGRQRDCTLVVVMHPRFMSIDEMDARLNIIEAWREQQLPSLFADMLGTTLSGSLSQTM